MSRLWLFKVEFRIVICFIFASCLLLLHAVVAPSLVYGWDKTVKIGVLANRGHEQALQEWSYTADYLTGEIPEYSFVIVPLDLDGLRQAVEKGKVDFVLTQPGSYVEMEALYGVTRILTLVNRNLGGDYTVFGAVIFARADREDIKELDDLRGKSFMGVQELGFGGFQMAWRELKKSGIDPYQDFARLQFSGFPQDIVVYAVRDGKADAGTVRTNALEMMAAEGKIKIEDFRILNRQQTDGFPFVHSTMLYPEWPFAKVKHTPEELARKVAIALLNLSSDSPAAKAANISGWTIPLDYQPVHECLKELHVGPYKNFGKVNLIDVVRQYWQLIVIIITSLIVLIVVTIHAQKINCKLFQSRLEASVSQFNTNYRPLGKKGLAPISSNICAAGLDRQILTEEAIQFIYQFSKGVSAHQQHLPRCCFRYKADSPTIDAYIVRKSKEDGPIKPPSLLSSGQRKSMIAIEMGNLLNNNANDDREKATSHRHWR